MVAKQKRKHKRWKGRWKPRKWGMETKENINITKKGEMKHKRRREILCGDGNIRSERWQQNRSGRWYHRSVQRRRPDEGQNDNTTPTKIRGGSRDNDGHYVAAGAAEDGEEEEYTEVGTDEEFESEEEEEEEDEEEDNDGHYVPAGAVPVRSGAVDANAQPPIVVLEDDGQVLVEAPGHSAGRASQSVEGEALGAAEGAEDERRPARGGEGEGQEDAGESIDTDIDMSLPHCPICMERWTCQGVHRVCCIPCGHVYGRSCLQTWVRRCGNNFAKCPQCKKRFKMKDIINLYAPQITVVNDDLEKEVNILREKNEILSMERKRLLEEVRKLKEDDMGEQDIRKLKKQCLHQVLPGATDMRSSKLLSDSHIHDGLTISGPNFAAQHSVRRPSPPSAFVLQGELALDGARVLDIDASSQILLVSRKPSGLSGGHVLTKISFLCPSTMQSIQLPDDTGTVKDLHFAPANTVLPGRLALLASLGKKLSIFSMESNNVVLKYSLPGPAWSCSWGTLAPFHIYTGLQDGTLLMFDIRQTSKPLESRAGLSRHPMHTIHSLAPNGIHSDRRLLTASSVGLCLWDVVGSDETSPMLVPETENQGVCISLACGSPRADVVASFRPKVEVNCDAFMSHPSQSLSPPVTGPVRLGTHVSFERVDGNNFQKRVTTSGNVSDVRLSRSAIIPVEGTDPLFVYGDEAFHGMCIWELASFQTVHRLKPHQHPILDIKYSNNMPHGLLGCISEKLLQVFRVTPYF